MGGGGGVGEGDGGTERNKYIIHTYVHYSSITVSEALYR